MSSNPTSKTVTVLTAAKITELTTKFPGLGEDTFVHERDYNQAANGCAGRDLTIRTLRAELAKWEADCTGKHGSQVPCVESSRVETSALRLGMDTPWPLPDVLAKLVQATKHLLDDHSCDTHGWEEYRTAAIKGDEYLQVLYARSSSVEPACEHEWSAPRHLHECLKGCGEVMEARDGTVRKPGYPYVPKEKAAAHCPYCDTDNPNHFSWCERPPEKATCTCKGTGRLRDPNCAVHKAAMGSQWPVPDETLDRSKPVKASDGCLPFCPTPCPVHQPPSSNGGDKHG